MDYDLVVIGNTPEAYGAAVAAVKAKLRVAWVEQPFFPSCSWGESLFARSFSYYVQRHNFLSFSTKGIASIPINDSSNFSLSSYVEEVDKIIAEQYSPAILAAQGIDVVRDSGEFCRLPQLSFVTDKRRLQSRVYLLATGFHHQVPSIQELNTVGFLTPRDLAQIPSLSQIPHNLAIIGGDNSAYELAINLAAIGKVVTLIMGKSQMLPDEEPEAARLIQATLEAWGVRLLTNSPVVTAKKIARKKWIQAGDRAVECDEIILATAKSPNIEGLNLAGVGVKWGREGIEHNARFQTTHPRIYTCGSATDAYIRQHQAITAWKNALFFPWFHLHRPIIPTVIYANPSVVRVGMTEKQARERYGKKILCTIIFQKNLAKAQMMGEITGFCKLVAHRNGRVLGIQLVGPQVEELLGFITLAMEKRLRVRHLASLVMPDFTIAEIVKKTAQDWQFKYKKSFFG